MVCKLESPTAINEVIQQIRQDEFPTGRLVATAAAIGKAPLDAEWPLEIGSLTIVDAPNWELWGSPVSSFRVCALLWLRGLPRPNTQSSEEIKHRVEGVRVLAEQFQPKRPGDGGRGS